MNAALVKPAPMVLKIAFRSEIAVRFHVRLPLGEIGRYSFLERLGIGRLALNALALYLGISPFPTIARSSCAFPRAFVSVHPFGSSLASPIVNLCCLPPHL